MQRIRSPFNTSAPALAAAAAAVRDQPYIQRIREHNAAWLLRIAKHVTALGIEVLPSVANFYLLRFPEHGRKNAHDAAAFLIGNGIIPRPVATQDAGGELRITVGTPAENEAVLAVLERYMRGDGA